MRFALLGNHPDGVNMANALVASGRHELVAYTVATAGENRQAWAQARLVNDLEEVLADPTVEAVIVAGQPANRPVQLRRAMQSERHVLCVSPAADRPDVAYEAGMIQEDTRKTLFAILPEALHPGIRRLAEWFAAADPATPGFSLLRQLDLDCWSPAELLINCDIDGTEPSVPGWHVLRAVGGEIAEVVAFTGAEELSAGEPISVSGRFEKGGLFRIALVPRHREARWCLSALGAGGRAELLFPLGRPGPAFLNWRDEHGQLREEAWDAFDPWPELVGAFEQAVATEEKTTWQAAQRALELDDAARRSALRRRAYALEYPQASEEVGFKGTMTLIGCGMLWVTVIFLILSYLFDALKWLRWIILLAIVVFLIMQILRFFVRRAEEGGDGGAD
jgi:predicted dehydrogenase